MRVSLLHLPCRRAFDCAAMRFILPVSRRIVTTQPPSGSLHHSAVRHGDHDASSTVFPDSLRKTLDAHRAANRASLIRIVPTGKKSSRESLLQRVAGDKSFQAPENALPEKQPAKQSYRNRWARGIDTRHQVASSFMSNWEKGKMRWGVNRTEGRSAQTPWLVHYPDYANDIPTDAAARLDAEIRALDAFLSPTPQEQNTMDQLITAVAEVLENVAPDPPLVAGSWGTGMAASHSDLDLVLPVRDMERSMDRIRKPSATRPQVLDVYHDLLRRVQRTIELNPIFDDQTFKSGKGLPNITAIHSATGMRLRFYCGEDVPSSLEYIKDYLSEYPAVRPLYRVTRLILESQGQFGISRSSFAPMGLVTLIVAFCKMNHGRFQRPHSLGDQLLAFLRTFGTDVNFRTTGVALDPPNFFTRESVRDEMARWPSPKEAPAHLRGQQSFMKAKRTAALRRNSAFADHPSIQDPMNFMNDLGRSCTRPADVQRAWAFSYQRLNEAVDAWDGWKQSPEQSILAYGLRANFDDFEKRRAILASTSSIH